MFDLERELLKCEKRLSSKTKDQILKYARVDGFESAYLYIHELIYNQGIKPKDIRRNLNIKGYIYYGIANKISLLKRDNIIQGERQKHENKVKGKMCGLCGKRKRVGNYYCKICKQKANITSHQIDIEMMGDY